MIDSLDKLAKVGDTHGKKALSKAGDKVKEIEVEVVKETHHKWSQDVGWKELKKYPVKVGKLGGKFINIGIRANVTSTQRKKDEKAKQMGDARPTHWDRIKGLWYNNYGFHHVKTGRYIAGSDWISRAYDNSVEEAYRIIREEMEKGMEL